MVLTPVLVYGCTVLVTLLFTVSSDDSESSDQGVAVNGSKRDDNQDQESEDERSIDQESAEQKSSDQDSDDEKSSNEDSDIKRSSDEVSDNEKSIDQSSENERSSDQDSDDERSDDEERSLRWKEGLANKVSRKKVKLQRLIYSITSTWSHTPINDDGGESPMEESGGVLLRQHKEHKGLLHRCDTSCVITTSLHWGDKQITALKSLCVTGSWGEDDATLQLQADSDDIEDDEVTMETDPDELVAKKQQQKAQFDIAYDDKDNDYFTEMKQKMASQAELNKSTFEGLPDELRWQLEGFSAGCYVRMEIKGIPCELVEKFDPRQPLILGGLSPGEEQLSYLQVRGGATCRVRAYCFFLYKSSIGCVLL